LQLSLWGECIYRRHCRPPSLFQVASYNPSHPTGYLSCCYTRGLHQYQQRQHFLRGSLGSLNGNSRFCS
jgi:hypothetical protein